MQSIVSWQLRFGFAATQGRFTVYGDSVVTIFGDDHAIGGGLGIGFTLEGPPGLFADGRIDTWTDRSGNAGFRSSAGGIFSLSERGLLRAGLLVVSTTWRTAAGEENYEGQVYLRFEARSFLGRDRTNRTQRDEPSSGATDTPDDLSQ